MRAAGLLLLLFLLPPMARAFEVSPVGDYGDVTVMEATGSYDELTPEGTVNEVPRQLVSKAFLQTHPDRYDFLVIFSNFDFAMESDTKAFYLEIKNDVQGIGLDLFDRSALYGSRGVLQGIIEMGNLERLSSDPLDPKFSATMGILSHEILHRWAARVRFREQDGSISTRLLGRDGAHWSFLLDTMGSVLYGNRWHENGDGTFTSLPGKKYFSPLDLYLMGLADPSEVPEMLLIDAPGTDPAELPRSGATISGTALRVSIGDIIAAEGERVPDASASPKSFTVACIFLARPGTFTGGELFRIRTILRNWELWFSSLTDGKAAIRIDAAPATGLPEKPDPGAPSADPRSAPPEIHDGVAWLVANQAADGSWADAPRTAERDTAAAVTALTPFPEAQESRTAGTDWLSGPASAGTDFLSRRISAIPGAGQETEARVRDLATRQNGDGGWGSGRGYTSNAMDTILALKALARAGALEPAISEAAARFLATRQHPDGGWGTDDGESRIAVTANLLETLVGREGLLSAERIQNGWTWLTARQNPDGGFGPLPGAVDDTAAALAALKSRGASSPAVDGALAYLLNHQSQNGSWYDSAWQTAMAVSAVLSASITPDLEIAPPDISFEPERVATLPAEVTIRARVRNTGTTDVPAATVALYRDAVSDENRISAQTLAVPGKSSVTASFTTTIQESGHHRFYLVVDPEGLVSESFETNNTALKTLYPETTHDFELLPEGLTVSPAAATYNDTLTITARIRNKGASDAFDVRLSYAVSADGEIFDILSTTIDVPAGKTVDHTFSWTANEAYLNGASEVRLLAGVDPRGHFSEISEENNAASASLNIAVPREPNLVVTHEGIAVDPDPAHEKGRAVLRARIRNAGFSEARNVVVAFRQGAAGSPGALLGTRTVAEIAQGGEETVSLEWDGIPAAGETLVTVEVDPENLLPEITETDNRAFRAVKILGLPDLAISANAVSLAPAAPREGDVVSVRVRIRNLGAQRASDVGVAVHEGDLQIHAETLPVIEGLADAEVSFSCTVPAKTGAHSLRVAVDPDNRIPEADEANNVAVKPYGVQDADLWLTETHISPNGDGVQDETRLFFRLEGALPVAAEVVGEGGERVRAFPEDELGDAAGGSVAWDGLADGGTLAPDGTYRIRVLGEGNKVLASLPVVLDTNRSTLGQAVRSRAILQRNLSCALPEIAEQVWLPDESALILSIPPSEENPPAYPNGIYAVTPDGREIRRLVPWEWAVGVDGEEEVRYSRFWVSPNGADIAFALTRVNKTTRINAGEELWCVGVDGSRLVSLLRGDTQETEVRIRDLAWSPGGERLAVRMEDRRTGGETLRILAREGTAAGPVDLSPLGAGRIVDASLGWSPDGARLSFAVSGGGQGRIGLVDTEGNARLLYGHSGGYRSLQWIHPGKLLLLTAEFGETACMLLDASEAGLHQEIADFNAAHAAVNPVADTFAFIRNGLSVTVCDAGGDCTVVHESDTFIDDLRWSADGRRLAFFSETHRQIEPCLFESAVVVVTPEAGRVQAMPVGYFIEAADSDIYGGPYDRCGRRFAEYPEPYRKDRFYYRFGSLAWLGHEDSLVMEEENRGLLAVGIGDPGGPVDLPVEKGSWFQVSPRGGAIAYEASVDPGAVCAGTGAAENTWSLGSLLNLTADLTVLKRGSGLDLRGVAADLNFASSLLEWADAARPDLWRNLLPPSEIPVVDGLFTTWVPPHEGTFLIRLIVTDLAGNRKQVRKRVSWGGSVGITNLTKKGELFSPNGDGQKDAVELHYRVLEPVHLEFSVLDAEDRRVRTFRREHAVPPGQTLDDHVAWDGKDEQGRTVPDGVYRIRVADLEFFFEVDNTPPDADLKLGRVMAPIERGESLDINGMILEMTGHAVDDNLRRWSIEYGRGDNPDQWYEYLSGKAPFRETDASGEASPVVQFCRDGKECRDPIPFATGRKFRISAVDFAGNRRTAVTGYSDEVLFLAAWGIPETLRGRYNNESRYLVRSSSRVDGNGFCDGNASDRVNRVPPELAAAGANFLYAFDTLREPISSLRVQHGLLKEGMNPGADLLENLDWFDSTDMRDPPTGGELIEIPWDSTGVGPDRPVVAVRLRAVSASGEIHDSLPVVIADLFSIATCARMQWTKLPPGAPGPSEDLDGYCENLPWVPEHQKTLSFSWRMPGEGDGAWREYLRYDAAAGDRIPVGVFPIPRPPEDPLPSVFDIRMRSELHSEAGDVEECVLVAAVDCGAPALLVEYPKSAVCGEASPCQAHVSGDRASGSTLQRVPCFGFDPSELKSVSLQLEEDAPRVLKRMDMTGAGADLLIVDTSTLEEGRHPVTLVADLVSGGTVFRKEAAGEIIADRTPPEARITFPTESSRFCPGWFPEGEGGWFAIEVEGSVADSILVQRYELWYGIGPEPRIWKPAMTREATSVRVGGPPYYPLTRSADSRPMRVPIVGEGSRRGLLGRWDVTGFGSGEVYSLMLKVVDAAGNVSCHTTTFTMDRQLHLEASCSARRFSPNGDGLFDDIDILWNTGESARVTARVVRGPGTVRTLISESSHEGGAGSVTWDGKDDAGVVVPDGVYAVKVAGVDACGNTVERTVSGITVDTTPPVLEIRYPSGGGVTGTVVEVVGTAVDPLFSGYRLVEEESGLLLGAASRPCEGGVLGRWNATGREGPGTLVLSASDAVGNTAMARTVVNIAPGPGLVTLLSVDPAVISPNGDGRLDRAEIRYGVGAACDVVLEIFSGSILVHRSAGMGMAPGEHGLFWDGRADDGRPVRDGTLRVVLTATSVSDSPVMQQEAVTLAVDTTPPVLALSHPRDRSAIRDEALFVQGEITDPNLEAYRISIQGQGGGAMEASGTGNRKDEILAVMDGLADGTYTLAAEAADLGKNESRTTLSFTLDRTPPEVHLDSPEAGSVQGGLQETVVVSGRVIDDNLASWALRYGQGDDPEAWTILMEGTGPPPEPLRWEWPTGGGLPDGRYTLCLTATDRAGWTSEARVAIDMDNTPPEIEITGFGENGFVRWPGDLSGTISDPNLREYRVEYAEGACERAFRWVPLRTDGALPEAGLLATLDVLPVDGDYCLRVTASDTAGNTTLRTRQFSVDTRPPGPPVLTGRLENSTDALLAWSPDAEPDIAGYNLYRDRRNLQPGARLTESPFVDAGLGEGIYMYTLTAVDRAGWESEPSDPVRIRVDLTPPEAWIRYPRSGAAVGGIVDIQGTAFSVEDFKQYRLYFRETGTASGWGLVRTSPVPLAYGPLFQWETLGLPETEYAFRIEAEDAAGNIQSHEIYLKVDNTPPPAPVLRSASSAGSDVDLAWGANTEPDLAGYLIYRNDRLATVNGTVIGDLTPYLVSGTAYRDAGLPDGLYRYELIAMDGAGNMSEPSNPVTVEIDTRPPRAHIVTPVDGARFEGLLRLEAASEDNDIAVLRFQFRPVSETAWTDVDGTGETAAFITRLDPAAASLDFGDYRLRVVATDRGGRTDPSPSEITVTYTDLAPPLPPEGLAARVTGGDVTLSWTAGTASDIAEYHVYRIDPDKAVRLNGALLMEASLTLPSLPDGSHRFSVTAVDAYGNESQPSKPVRAEVFTPWLDQPFTPTDHNRVRIDGGGVPEGGTRAAALFREIDGEKTSVEHASCIPDGTFAFEPTLLPGENHLTVVVSDSAGNTSRPSERVVVVHNEAPAAPENLAASPEAKGCLLSWDPVPEPDVVGYHLYRNGVKINAEMPVTGGTAAASLGTLAQRAIDGKEATYWQSGAGPAWWQIAWDAPRMIRRIEIAWLSEYGSLYAGKDYEIQVWSGYRWIPRFNVTGNLDQINAFELTPAYVTDRIRIVVTASTVDSWRFVGISEVRLWEENPIQTTVFEDLNVADGEYEYRVTAVDRYGFESPLSDPAHAAVGDILPPEAPADLLAQVAGSNVSLSWRGDPDASAYRVFRKTESGWSGLARVMEAACLDSGLKNGTHLYRVTAVDAAGNESPPSNEALATVHVTLPFPPLNPVVTPVPEGSALDICWEAPAGAPGGYMLYRSTSPESGYAPVFEAPVSGTCYRDEALANDTRHYYRVVSVDALGNESDFSETLVGVPRDTIPPPAPALFSPTLPGLPIPVPTESTGVSGWAEPSAEVGLFEGGELRGTAQALAEDDIEVIPVDEENIRMIALSPDSRAVAMVYGSMSPVTVVKDLDTGTVTRVTSGSGKPVWSPDSRKIAYTVHDAQWNQRIELFDRDTGLRSRLSDDAGVNEWDPSWSTDGARMACVSDRGGQKGIWLVDLSSGESTPIPIDAADPGLPFLSPDGNKVACLAGNGPASLFVIDIQGGDPVQIGTGIPRGNDGREAFSWSPDGKAVGFVRNTPMGPRILVWSAESRTAAEVDVDEIGITGFRWSPDGRRIAFTSASGGETRIWTSPFQTSEQGPSLLARVRTSAVASLDWTPSGRIHFWNPQDHGCYVGFPAGFFHIPGVWLHSGENTLHAIAVDASGNRGPASEAILLRHATAPLPDPSVQAVDLGVHPPAPIDGETAVISAVIRNPGQAVATGTGVRGYLWSAQGDPELIYQGSLPDIAPGGASLLRFEWDSTGRAGLNRLIIVLDDEGRIREASEANNLAGINFHVAGEAGVALLLRPASDRLEARQPVPVQISLFNSGPAVEGHVESWIEDESGIRMEEVGVLPVALHYGSMTQADLKWNTGVKMAGTYRFHAAFTSDGKILAEAAAPFFILPDLEISATVTTDRPVYPAHREVRAGLRIDASGENSLTPPLAVELSILSGEEILFTERRQVAAMMPGSSVSLSWTWNTGANPPGGYAALARVFSAEEEIASARKDFQIDGGLFLKGALAVVPQEVPAGGMATLRYTVANIGNQPVKDLPLTLALADPETLEILRSETASADIGVAETATGERTFSTEGLALKPFKAFLKYQDAQGASRLLSSVVFSVRDLSGPEIRVLSPAVDAATACRVVLDVMVKDDASGVRAVEYRIDDGSWIPMPAADAATGRFASSWLPPGPGSGVHRIQFRAADTAGNVGLSGVSELRVASAVENVTGEIQVAEETMFAGSRIRGWFSVADPCGRNIGNLPVRISIAGHGSEAVLQTLDKTIRLSGTDPVSEPWEIPLSEIPPGDYRAILQTGAGGSTGARMLSTAAFQVRPAVEAEKAIALPIHLLVWINDGCHPGGGGNASECRPGGCIRTDLLAPILDEITDGWHIVQDRADMEMELRNPLVTDVLILGDQHPLTGHYGDELAEKVFSGTGLVSSLWLSHGNSIPLELGVRFKGRFSPPLPVVHLESPIDGDGAIPVLGRANRVERKGKARVLAEFRANSRSVKGPMSAGNGSPAIVADETGRGKTVYLAFDLGRSLTGETADRMKALLRSALHGVHPPEAPPVFHPGMMVPVRLSIANPGEAVDIRITETFPAGVEVYDPVTGAWWPESPWTAKIHLAAGESRDRVYYLQAPSTPGIHATETEIRIEGGGESWLVDRLRTELPVGKGWPEGVEDAIHALNALAPAGKDRSRIDGVIRQLERARDRRIRDLQDIAGTIHELLTAVHSLISVTSVDITTVRLELDQLLRVLGSRYYGFDPAAAEAPLLVRHGEGGRE